MVILWLGCCRNDWIVDGPRQQVGVVSGIYIVSIVPETVGDAELAVQLGTSNTPILDSPYPTYIVPGPISSEGSQAPTDQRADDMQVEVCTLSLLRRCDKTNPETRPYFVPMRMMVYGSSDFISLA